MGKKKKKLQFTAANNIVSFNRDDVQIHTQSELHDYADYVIARNAARMLLSENICPYLFQQAMNDEQEYQGMYA